MKQRSLYIAFLVIVLAIAIISIIGILTARRTTPPLQGTIEASEVRVSGKLAGRVSEIYVRKGDWVSRGDTLIAIHSPEPRVETISPPSKNASATSIAATR